MGAEGDKKEIRTGDVTVDRGSGAVNLGNILLVSKQTIKEKYPVPSGKTGGNIDYKEWIKKILLKIRMNDHTYQNFAEMYGLDPVDVSVGNADVDDESILLTGSYENGDWISLIHGSPPESPIDIDTTILTFVANPNTIASDTGKPVLGGTSGDGGTLLAYDNSAKTWVVQRDDPGPAGDKFDVAEVVSVTGGTGTGTTTGASNCDGLWTAASQGGSELTKLTDYVIDHAGSRIARMAGGAINDGDTVYLWYRYTTKTAKKFQFGLTQVSTQAKVVYTHALQNGKDYTLTLNKAVITNDPEITHVHEGALSEWDIEWETLESNVVGEEVGKEEITV